MREKRQARPWSAAGEWQPEGERGRPRPQFQFATFGARLDALVEKIVLESAAGRPADAVLRDTLRLEREFSPEDKRQVAHRVYEYFRWRGWLDAATPMSLQLDRARELAGRFAASPDTFTDEELQRAVPEWVRGEMDVTPEWLRSLLAEPPLWLRARQGQGKLLAAKLGQCDFADDPAFADALRYDGAADLFHTPEYLAGEFEVQDIASQAVGLLCQPQPGETWWDACAGEGGKLLHLSDLMQNRGLIWASDRAEWRLKNLKRRTARAKCFNYRSELWDGGAKLPTKTKFDGVLVDAPCTGIGTWQRNPHARWTTTPQDVRELSVIQQRLLAHAAGSVKPGGRLIYAVCTLSRAETDAIATAFNAAQPDFEPVVIGENQPTLTLWPQDLGGNGMFIAVWRRK